MQPSVDEPPALGRIDALWRAYQAIDASTVPEPDRKVIDRLLDHEFPQLRSLYLAALAMDDLVESGTHEQSRMLFERGLATIEREVRSRLEGQVVFVLERLKARTRELDVAFSD